MRYTWLDEYLLQKRGVTKDLQPVWNWVRYMIGGRMFAAVCLDETNKPYYINLKLEPMEGEFYRAQYPDVIPGYYSDKLHWNSIRPDGAVPDELLRQMLDKSYALVLAGLPKKQQRAALGLTVCGAECISCELYGKSCPGCGGGPGNQSCTFARCSLTHGGPEFCWECGEYPCHRYEGFDRCDSFLPHSTRQRDIARAGALGLPGYLAEMDQRREILRQLMEGWNDGRRKTLFHTAVVLLPLEELQGVMAALPEGDALPPKERAKAAAALLEEAAVRQGLSLKLRKHPEKEPK